MHLLGQYTTSLCRKHSPPTTSPRAVIVHTRSFAAPPSHAPRLTYPLHQPSHRRSSQCRTERAKGMGMRLFSCLLLLIFTLAANAATDHADMPVRVISVSLLNDISAPVPPERIHALLDE